MSHDVSLPAHTERMAVRGLLFNSWRHYLPAHLSHKCANATAQRGLASFNKPLDVLAASRPLQAEVQLAQPLAGDQRERRGQQGAGLRRVCSEQWLRRRDAQAMLLLLWGRLRVKVVVSKRVSAKGGMIGSQTKK